uniref:Uncharacterized protein n=1 Tax=Compsopogon caeruleus TaxID=31354 RepID=A0A7S1XBM2_9RHOD|mmetsp:Transcript_12005/g.24445  ORF Transcript_12005/g.24445 Transcript_12005/m.24445 type:complete len:106 (+) Transcript_12005:438-755(+)
MMSLPQPHAGHRSLELMMSLRPSPELYSTLTSPTVTHLDADTSVTPSPVVAVVDQNLKPTSGWCATELRSRHFQLALPEFEDGHHACTSECIPQGGSVVENSVQI